jgi:hypothetical protein
LRFSSLTATSALNVKRPKAPVASSSTMWAVIVGSATITTRVRSRPIPAIAGTLGHCVECLGEEAIRLVRQHGRPFARPADQCRHEVDILDLAAAQGRLDMRADGAVADQAES